VSERRAQDVLQYWFGANPTAPNQIGTRLRLWFGGDEPPERRRAHRTPGGPPMFQRIAIVNRGEAAMRFIHAALELNREGERLHTIALYTEPDRNALFVREADEAFDLGPAMVAGADGRRKTAYVDLARLEEALRRTRAEAGVTRHRCWRCVARSTCGATISSGTTPNSARPANLPWSIHAMVRREASGNSTPR